MNESKKVWIVAGYACPDCGGRLTVRVFGHKPSQQEERDMEDKIGGWCQSTNTFELEIDGESGEYKSYH